MKKSLVLFAAFTFCFLCACSAISPKSTTRKESDDQSTKAVYQKISGKEAQAMMNDGKPYILLDVRTDEEFKESRIEGAILIPDYEIGSRVEKELPDKNSRILIYCRSGRRSALAAKDIINMGYTNVYDFGGIIDWPYDTVSG